MDVKKKLQEMMDERHWSYYRLAKESGVSWSTIRNMFERGTEPTLPTLEALCAGLQISLADLLLGEHPQELTEEQKELLLHWNALSAEDKRLLINVARSMGKKGNEHEQDKTSQTNV